MNECLWNLGRFRRQPRLLLAGEATGDWRMPVLLDAVAVALGFAAVFVGSGLRTNDPIYSLVVPYYGFFNAALTVVMCMTAGLAIRRTEIPTAGRRRMFLCGIPLLAAFCLHLANAGAFRCAEVSVVACVLGFLMRCGAVLAVAAKAIVIVLVVGSVARLALSARATAHAAGWRTYVNNVVSLTAAASAVGLLAYELLVLWRMHSLWWYVPTVVSNAGLGASMPGV